MNAARWKTKNRGKLILRIASDSYSLVLYSAGKDKLIAATSLVAMLSSAVLLLIAAPTAGMLGVALAFFITSVIVFVHKAYCAHALIKF